MSVTEELIRGLELTLTGMVTVFLLLVFMVLVIQWMSKLAHHLQPPKRQQPSVSTRRVFRCAGSHAGLGNRGSNTPLSKQPALNRNQLHVFKYNQVLQEFKLSWLRN